MGGRGYRKLNKFKPFDANTICDETGFKKKVSEVVERWDGFRVIPEAWNPQQPQDFPPTITKPILFPESKAESSYPSLWVELNNWQSILASLNPSGWWPFTEGSGLMSNDWSQINGNINAVGNGNNGTATAGVLYAGEFRNYASFDGASNIVINDIILGSIRSFNFFMTWDTLGGVFWCEGDIRESTTEPGGTPKGYEISVWDKDSDEFGFEVYYYAAGGFKTAQFNLFGLVDEKPSDGELFKLSVVFSGMSAGDLISVYYNGILVDIHTLLGDIENSSLPRRVGDNFDNSGYTGEINHFQLFDRAITVDEVNDYIGAIDQFYESGFEDEE